MVTMLWNLVGPLLLVGGFYALLGGAIWIILRPAPWHLPLGATIAPPWRLADLPIGRAVLRQAFWLLMVGLVGLLIPAPGWFRLLASQAVAAAVLLVLLDWNQRRHDAEQADRQLLAALRHPLALVAADALRQAGAAGWLTNGSLAGQSLPRVQWAGAQLAGIDLRGSNLTGADLQGADLRAARLSGCILDDACLAHADLTGASLTTASLVGTQAKAANFAHADLRRADLRHARLADADFTAASLDDALLAGAGLKGARLDHAQLTAARYDETTRWPKRFDPVQAGALPEKVAAQLPQDPEHSRDALR